MRSLATLANSQSEGKISFHRVACLAEAVYSYFTQVCASFHPHLDLFKFTFNWNCTNSEEFVCFSNANWCLCAEVLCISFRSY